MAEPQNKPAPATTQPARLNQLIPMLDRSGKRTLVNEWDVKNFEAAGWRQGEGAKEALNLTGLPDVSNPDAPPKGGKGGGTQVDPKAVAGAAGNAGAAAGGAGA